MEKILAAGIVMLTLPLLASAACQATPISCPSGQQLFYAASTDECPNGHHFCKANATAPAAPTAPATPTPPVTPSPPTTSTPAPKQTPASASLSFGSRGTAVSDLQTKLITLGYLAAGNNTGYFGVLTRAAVQALQRAHNIVSSGAESTTGYGVAGPRTKAALASARSASTTTQAPSAQTPTNPTIAELQERVQQLLVQIQTLTGSVNTTTATTPTTQTTTQTTQLNTQTTQTTAQTNTTTTQTTQTTHTTLPVNASCGFNGQTVTHGGSVTAYQAASVPSGQACQSQTRSCSKGTLSGTYTNATCVIGTAPTSCTWNNQTVANGTSITAYQSSSVAFGQTCASQQRTCSNGTFSGSYQSSSCTVTTPLPSPSGPIVPTIAPCTAKPSNTCATITNATGKHDVWISDKSLNLIDAALMGTHPINGASHDLAYIDASYTDSVHSSNGVGRSISIIDLTDAKLVGWAGSPEGYGMYDTYFSTITGPRGEKYPFVAPGQRSLTIDHWAYLCIFDPAYSASPSPSCWTGFKPYQIDDAEMVQKSGFRHDGGWTGDVNGDGWGDINLPYLKYIVTISGKTGDQLALSLFDVAAQSEPNAPPYFHSGRFYGSFTAFANPNSGTTMVFLANANAVGTFSDVECNVSRYFTLARFMPSGFALDWSKYLSFGKTIFKPPYDSIDSYSRLGDELNKCAHRFGDSLVWLAGKPKVVFSLFTKQNPAPECQNEILAEQRSGFVQTDVAAERACRLQNALPVAGSWSLRVLDGLSGADISSSPNSYVWGRADTVIPNTSATLLVQHFTKNSGVVRFDQTAEAIEAFAIVQLAGNGSLTELSRLVSPPAPPKIIDQVNYYGAYPQGLGSSWGGIPELSLKDIDGDGLNDIELTNGRWIGYSRTTQSLVLKSI